MRDPIPPQYKKNKTLYSVPFQKSSDKLIYFHVNKLVPLNDICLYGPRICPLKRWPWTLRLLSILLDTHILFFRKVFRSRSDVSNLNVLIVFQNSKNNQTCNIRENIRVVDAKKGTTLCLIILNYISRDKCLKPYLLSTKSW